MKHFFETKHRKRASSLIPLKLFITHENIKVELKQMWSVLSPTGQGSSSIPRSMLPMLLAFVKEHVTDRRTDNISIMEHVFRTEMTNIWWGALVMLKQELELQKQPQQPTALGNESSNANVIK